jgi:hypothetical protein
MVFLSCLRSKGSKGSPLAKLMQRTYAPSGLQIRVDILPKHSYSQVKCLPKKPENGWSCCKAPWIC